MNETTQLFPFLLERVALMKKHLQRKFRCFAVVAVFFSEVVFLSYSYADVARIIPACRPKFGGGCENADAVGAKVLPACRPKFGGGCEGDDKEESSPPLPGRKPSNIAIGTGIHTRSLEAFGDLPWTGPIENTLSNEPALRTQDDMAERQGRLVGELASGFLKSWARTARIGKKGRKVLSLLAEQTNAFVSDWWEEIARRQLEYSRKVDNDEN